MIELDGPGWHIRRVRTFSVAYCRSLGAVFIDIYHRALPHVDIAHSIALHIKQPVDAQLLADLHDILELILHLELGQTYVYRGAYQLVVQAPPVGLVGYLLSNVLGHHYHHAVIAAAVGEFSHRDLVVYIYLGIYRRLHHIHL